MNIELLSEIRRQGLHQFELAHKAGITESALSKLIHERAISAVALRGLQERVASALGVDVQILFPGRE